MGQQENCFWEVELRYTAQNTQKNKYERLKEFDIVRAEVGTWDEIRKLGT